MKIVAVRLTKAKEFHFDFRDLFVNVKINQLKTLQVLNKSLISIDDKKKSKLMQTIKQMMMKICI